ncbi:hypothetical protein [Flavobacterium cellulosilyticum]|uniref:Uncharacterized protein n=1 Tax=Flavobacterium cellulosilyticum TaxID=2541731 RepID=A0A4R5CJC7_9FLAO|nr:hypothetical protein [Flavobacterium cellulosilyticum]TDD98423.1 hypothetical protein E0F76_04605 [Flavobacterium cellulosilyticum]
MKNVLYILLFLCSYSVFSQQKAIEVTNIITGKITVYEINQRIKIRTLDGKKSIGKLNFSDNETILINKKSIKFDSIQSIQKQPKIFGTLKTIVLAAGLSLVGTSLVAASNGKESAFLFFTIGSSISISSGLLERINASNTNRKCVFKIIEK